MGRAIITGASAGLGAQFARLFAADKHDLVLVARRRERLEELAAEVGRAHGVKSEIIAVDLGRTDGWRAVVEAVGQAGLEGEIDFLVNNAGFGSNGVFWQLDAARELEMVQLNVSALMGLTRALLPGMVARGRGRVLNIGSTAGFQPGPFMATYYATKAFVISFTEALAYELRGSGVTATVSCPGATATEFASVAGNDKSRLFAMGSAAAPVVAREAYRAMMAGRSMVIHGWKNAFGVQALRVSPRATVCAIAASLNRLGASETKALPGR